MNERSAPRSRDAGCGRLLWLCGTFCVKYPDISVRMTSDKVRSIVSTGAGDRRGRRSGMFANIAGRLQREGHHVQTRHVAELLAGMTRDVRAIGEPSQ